MPMTDGTKLWRCARTHNLCGTDTEMIGRPCQCDSCIAHREIQRLTAERDQWQHKWMALAQASLLAGTIRNPT